MSDSHGLQVGDRPNSESISIGYSDGNTSNLFDALDVLVFDDEIEESFIEPVTSTFEQLPPNVMDKIFENLDDIDLLHLGSTNHQMYNMVWKPEIWVPRCRGFQNVHNVDLSLHIETMKDKKQTHTAFTALAQLEKSTQRRIEQNQYIENQNRVYRQRVERFEYFLDAIFLNRSMDYLSLFSVALGVFFVMFKLDDKILFSWRKVLLPFMIPIIQLILIMTSYDCLRHCLHGFKTPERNYFLWRSFIVHRRQSLLQSYIIAICLTLSYAFLMIKVNGLMDGIHVAFVIVPWIIMAVGYLIQLILRMKPRNLNPYDRCIIAMFLLIFIIQCILLILRIEEDIQWKWRIVLVPTWISFCYTVAVPIFTWIVNYIWPMVGASQTSKYLNPILLGLIGFWAFVFAPTLAFLGMMAQELDSTSVIRTWVMIFSPLIFVLSVFLIISIIVDIPQKTN